MSFLKPNGTFGLLDALLSPSCHLVPVPFQSRIPALGLGASLTLSSIWTLGTFVRSRGAGSATHLMVPFPPQL